MAPRGPAAGAVMVLIVAFAVGPVTTASAQPSDEEQIGDEFPDDAYDRVGRLVGVDGAEDLVLTTAALIPVRRRPNGDRS